MALGVSCKFTDSRSIFREIMTPAKLLLPQIKGGDNLSPQSFWLRRQDKNVNANF